MWWCNKISFYYIFLLSTYSPLSVSTNLIFYWRWNLLTSSRKCALGYVNKIPALEALEPPSSISATFLQWWVWEGFELLVMVILRNTCTSPDMRGRMLLPCLLIAVRKVNMKTLSTERRITQGRTLDTIFQSFMKSLLQINFIVMETNIYYRISMVRIISVFFFPVHFPLSFPSFLLPFLPSFFSSFLLTFFLSPSL